mmetsp:Transcript_91736/g.285943  ORF Transcript_91736/g.285943 Transcript_91736/m.285943 type:complete len:371 (-) Transcript_91736:23-1135(-)
MLLHVLLHPLLHLQLPLLHLLHLCLHPGQLLRAPAALVAIGAVVLHPGHLLHHLRLLLHHKLHLLRHPLLRPLHLLLHPCHPLHPPHLLHLLRLLHLLHLLRLLLPHLLRLLLHLILHPLHHLHVRSITRAVCLHPGRLRHLRVVVPAVVAVAVVVVAVAVAVVEAGPALAVARAVPGDALLVALDVLPQAHALVSHAAERLGALPVAAEVAGLASLVALEGRRELGLHPRALRLRALGMAVHVMPAGLVAAHDGLHLLALLLKVRPRLRAPLVALLVTPALHVALPHHPPHLMLVAVVLEVVLLSLAGRERPPLGCNSTADAADRPLLECDMAAQPHKAQDRQQQHHDLGGVHGRCLSASRREATLETP